MCICECGRKATATELTVDSVEIFSPTTMTMGAQMVYDAPATRSCHRCVRGFDPRPAVSVDDQSVRAAMRKSASVRIHPTSRFTYAVGQCLPAAEKHRPGWIGGVDGMWHGTRHAARWARMASCMAFLSGLWDCGSHDVDSPLHSC